MNEYFESAGDCLRRLAFRDEARREFVYGVLSPDQLWLNAERDRLWLLKIDSAPAASAALPIIDRASPHAAVSAE